MGGGAALTQRGTMNRTTRILTTAAASAVVLTGAATAAHADELPPYECLLSIPLLEKASPIVLAGIGCQAIEEAAPTATSAPTHTPAPTATATTAPAPTTAPTTTATPGPIPTATATAQPPTAPTRTTTPIPTATATLAGTDDSTGADTVENVSLHTKPNTPAKPAEQEPKEQLAQTGPGDDLLPLAGAGALLATGSGILLLRRRPS